MSAFRGQDATVYRPFADEHPWEVLADPAVPGDDGPGWAEVWAPAAALDLVRVAKFEGRIIGAYGIRPLTPTRFELVALRVAPGYRRSGLGRWLLGHAIGLAEAKGAREIVTPDQAQRAFLQRSGFVPEGSGMRLTLTPE